MKTFKLKLSDTLVQAIAKAFSIGKNLVDQGELKAFYLKEYPGTQLPPEKEKKTKKDKKSKKDKNDKETKEPKSEEEPNEVKFKDKTTKSKPQKVKII